MEVFIRPMLRIFAQDFPYSSWIGGMPVRCDLFRRVTDNRKRLSEKLLGCLHIPFLGSSANQPNCHLRQWLDRGSTTGCVAKTLGETGGT
jgi:hypothetical protein